jgi:hypothetical protein
LDIRGAIFPVSGPSPVRFVAAGLGATWGVRVCFALLIP